MTFNPYLIHPATIVERKQEATDIVTFRLQLTEPAHRESFRFEAGQFNMLYVFGVGEVAISIVSDPDEPEFLDHTIRIVGRITQVLGNMQKGQTVGVRGPFGMGWPVHEAEGKDVLIVTGGLGCAPVVGAIEYIFRRRARDRKDDYHEPFLAQVTPQRWRVFARFNRRLICCPHPTLSNQLKGS